MRNFLMLEGPKLLLQHQQMKKILKQITAILTLLKRLVKGLQKEQYQWVFPALYLIDLGTDTTVRLKRLRKQREKQDWSFK